jgi:hypothetical protein
MNINGMAQSVNGRALFRLFDRNYLRRASATERADLLLALAFRQTRRHREASLIIENWERQR